MKAIPCSGGYRPLNKRLGITTDPKRLIVVHAGANAVAGGISRVRGSVNGVPDPRGLTAWAVMGAKVWR